MKEVEHMNIELRLETPADYAETEKVVREAFWNVYAPGCTEHYLVHVMRSSENFVREVLTLGPIAMLQRHTANIASGFKRKAKSL